jgi:DNA-binding HxlR family transcriptional regulator
MTTPKRYIPPTKNELLLLHQIREGSVTFRTQNKNKNSFKVAVRSLIYKNKNSFKVAVRSLIERRLISKSVSKTYPFECIYSLTYSGELVDDGLQYE